MITKEAVKAVIEQKKNDGIECEEIEKEFAAALKFKLINIDIYALAMEEIYK